MALLDEFPDAKGTKYYLEVTKNIVNCYLDKELGPLQRIENSWFAVVFVRYWRQYILSREQYTLEKNFITLNTYLCIELNAHALISALIILRDSVPNLSSNSYMYFPWLLGSQTCERAFRAARSMSPVFSTVINFNILGLLRRLHRLQVQMDLQSESHHTGIMFPHQDVHKKKDGLKSQHEQHVALGAISNTMIEVAVQAGMARARHAMEELGIKEFLVKAKKWNMMSKIITEKK